MNKIYLIFTISLSLFLPLSAAYAEDDIFGDDELFLQDDNNYTPQSQQTAPLSSSFLSTKIDASTMKVISKSEKVFCYTVDYPSDDYDGYMINGLALKGSCGELSEAGKKLIYNSLLTNNSAYSVGSENCSIEPKIMLRYIYGVDYTDVLLSSPCHSLTFFHERDFVTVNAAPGAQIIEQIVKAYSGLEEKFLSPALLGQMVANGQIVNQSQKEIVRRLSPVSTPTKKWGNDAAKASLNKPSAPTKTGWNKLK